MSIDENSRMLVLHPEDQSDRSDLNVTIGSEFTTNVTLHNRDMAPMDQLRILISYEPDFLEPVSINDSPISDHLRGNPVAEVDPLLGIVLYEAELAEPLAINDAPLLKVRWKAKQITFGTRLDFGNREDLFTTVNSGGVDLLGQSDTPGDGTLNMNVTILPQDPKEAEAMLSDPRIYDSPGGKIGGARIFMRPENKRIVVGEPFTIDLMLDNRAMSMLDGLSVLIEFDPEVISILDEDWDNWITREKNILDGPFREDFPWDFHIANTVYSTRGYITYRVGTGDGELTRGKLAPFAQIHAVAKKPTAGTAFVFKFSKRPRSHATEATFIGHDVLGAPDIFGDGTKGVIITVHPNMDDRRANAK